VLTAGLCVGATLKLGSDSVGALNHIFQSTSPALYVLPSGNVGIGTSTPVSALEVLPATGYSILAGSFKIGNVALPTADADAATKGYIDSVLSYMASTSTFWDGSMTGNIWSLNSGNVGIGTTTPNYRLEVNGLIGLTGLQAIGSAANADLVINPKGYGQVVIGGGGWTYATAASGKGSILFNNGSSDTPNMKFVYGNNLNYGIDSAGSLLRFIKQSDESGGAVIGYFDVNGNFMANGKGTFGTNAVINGGGISYFNGGNVGIGTTTPLGKLAVAGAIQAGIAESNTIGLASWSAINANYMMTGPVGYWGLRSGTDHSINFDVHNSNSPLAALTILQGGNVGIGTTTPVARLQVIPASGYSILAGNYRIGDVASPLFDADAATKGYVDSALSSATSSMTSIATYVGMTTVAVNGSNSSYGDGYNIANGLCNSGTTGYSGSHVCTSFEMLYSIISGITMPTKNVWIFVGPPAYTASANDCEGRTSAAAAPSYGAYWEAPSTNYPQGRGLLGACSAAVELACCQ
jgi:hypothetical protein